MIKWLKNANDSIKKKKQFSKLNNALKASDNG